MTGLKPVEDETEESAAESDVQTTEIQTKDGVKERVTFGVIDDTAYTIYLDGTVDISFDGQALRIPAKLADSLSKDYHKYLHDS